MPKMTYPVDVLDIDNGHVLGFLEKGHISTDKMAESVCHYWSPETKIKNVRHIFARWIPINDEDYGCSLRLKEEKTSRRGNFAATRCDVSNE